MLSKGDVRKLKRELRRVALGLLADHGFVALDQRSPNVIGHFDGVTIVVECAIAFSSVLSVSALLTSPLIASASRDGFQVVVPTWMMEREGARRDEFVLKRHRYDIRPDDAKPLAFVEDRLTYHFLPWLAQHRSASDILRFSAAEQTPTLLKQSLEFEACLHEWTGDIEAAKRCWQRLLLEQDGSLAYDFYAAAAESFRRRNSLLGD